MKRLFLFLPLIFAAGCQIVPTEEDRALAEQFDYDYYLAGKNTPAEFMVNQSATPSAESKAILKGRLIPSDPAAYDTARKRLRDLESEVRKGMEWPEKQPPAVSIPYTRIRPEIDGLRSEAAWKNALTFRDEYPVSVYRKARTGSVWSVMWDENFLYVSAEFRQPNPTAEPYDPDAGKAPWRADALECFIGSGIRFRTYWEIVVAPDGSVYDALGQNNRWGSCIATPEDSVHGLSAAANRSPAGYSVELAVPWREIPGYERGNPPRPGETVNFTLIRCRNGKQSACHPLLYGGHNIFGHLHGTLVR